VRDLRPLLRELLRLGDLGLDFRIGDLLGGAGQRLDRRARLRRELGDRGRDPIVRPGELAIPGDDALRLLALRRRGAGGLAEAVERAGHVAHLVDRGRAWLALLALAGGGDEGGQGGAIAALLRAPLQIEAAGNAGSGEDQHAGDDPREHLRAQPRVRALAAAHDVDADGGLPEPQDVAVEELDVVDALAVEPDPVGRAHVLDPDLAVDLADLGVPAGHGAVLHRDVALIRAPDRHADGPHRVRLLHTARPLDDEVRGNPVEQRGVD